MIRKNKKKQGFKKTHGFFERERGFSLVELIVSLSIMSMISIAILADYSGFQEDIQLKNIAYEVAGTIKQAQIYGASVREYEGSFGYPYGVHFDATSPQSYVLFVDNGSSNNRYDNNDDVVKTFTLRQGFRVAKFCGVRPSGVRECGLDGSGDINGINAVFERPMLNAKYLSNTFNNYESIEVYLQGRDENTQVQIKANLTGQIYVVE